ncbi:DUF3795 domain-containing protein [Qiania dongpingensis]|nr:DUF3795 domain-containing protein [Qiania dongpingensis]
MTENKEIAPCGVVCKECDEFERSCGGCNSLEGKAAWVPVIGKEVCPLYDCSVNGHKYKSCGECSELPCQMFRELRDPAMTDEEFEKSIQDRLKVLREC